MPQIDLVDNMKKAPAECVCCHTNPMENGLPQKAIDLNVDVDWGNNAYLCKECVDVICELWGWMPEDEARVLMQKMTDLEGRHKRLRGKYIKLRDRVEKIKAGRKAERG